MIYAPGHLHLQKITIPLLFIPFLLSLSGHELMAEEQQTKPDSLSAIFTEGKFEAVIKTLYFRRDYDDDTPDWSSLAIGGNLNYETAPLFGFTFGFGVKTSQGDLTSSDDEVYRGLLAMGDTAEDDESYTELDEYFLRYSNWNSQAALGAQAVRTPWIDGYDIRMTPKKYRGLTVQNNSFENVEIHAMYLTDWLDWASEDWQSITAGITGDDHDDQGVLAGGLAWSPMEGLKLQLWNYYFNDVLNDMYVKADYNRKISQDFTLAVNLRYLDQADVGEALDGTIDTYQAGGIISLKAYGAKLALYYGENGEDDIRAPFGGDKLVIMQTTSLSRADEDLFSLKLDYNFKAAGIPGLTAYIFYTEFNTPETGATASPDIEELNFSIKYAFGGKLDDFSIWLRHAIVNQDDDIADGRDWTDSRVYLQYRF